MLTSVRHSIGLLLAGLTTVAAQTLPPPGFRPVPPGTHALVGARVFTQPDTSFSNATVVIRDGRIAAIGPEVTPPADARVWDLSGRTVYAGWIDPYLTLGSTNRPIRIGTAAGRSAGAEARATETSAGGYRFFGVPGQESDPGAPGPGYALGSITPQVRVADAYAPDPKQLESLRELGFTAGNVVPTRGILRGQSAFVTLGSGSPNEAFVTPDTRTGTAQHVAFEIAGGDEPFPDSLMGVIAAIRQVFFDAQWWAEAQAAAVRDPLRAPRVAANEALQALQAARDRQPVVFEPGSVLMVDRARLLAAELGLKQVQIVSTGEEWRRPDLIPGDRIPFIVPLAFPALPKLPAEDAWESVSLDALRAWDWAPENPAVLRKAGATIALTTFGLGDRKEFRKNLRAALDRGLSETDALAALTTVPARLCGVDQLLGTLAPGKLANLTICDSKGYFDPEGKVVAVWVEGRPYVFPEESGDKATAKAKPNAEEDKASAEKTRRKESELRDLARKRTARDPHAGRGILTNPPSLWIRGATVWTCGPGGTLTNAVLRVDNGRIQSVGPSTGEPGPGVVVVDGTGLHVTPGLIDCHSHSAILGGVNESGLPSTAMVRIGDVV
ncbi:MAG: amidohydrolase family protein, partial [Verrucomicrobiales bacterium]|nr:amidohydrolase family protein [Verrucomicrobiales bacterium]